MRGNGFKLAAITKEFSYQWQQTKEYWNDAKSEEFEHKYIEELLSNVDKAVAVIDELDKLVGKIRSDCE
jgi:hypothetical protein